MQQQQQQPDISQMVPITFGFTSTYAHTILNFNGTSILPQQLANFHSVSQADFTKTAQELDTLLVKNYGVEERKDFIMRICAVLAIGLIPLIGFLIYYSIDELYLRRKRDTELREKMQRILDEHNEKIYNPKGISLVLDVGLTLNSFRVPIESWEIKVVSYRVQLPPPNQPLASPVKLYESRCTFNRSCRLFNSSLPSSLKEQYGLGDEWKHIVETLNQKAQDDLDYFYNYVTAPVWWTMLVGTFTLFILHILAFPFILIYLGVIYFAKIKPQSEEMRNVIMPQLVKEANEKHFLPKGLRLALVQHEIKSGNVATLYLVKQ